MPAGGINTLKMMWEIHMGPFYPAYFNLTSAEIDQRVQTAYARLLRCGICPADCLVDRTRGELGKCNVGLKARVPYYGVLRDEEAAICGWRGSGALYFGGCNLHCQFCNTFDINAQPAGREMEPEEMAAIMLALQDQGVHNIHLVTPSHVVPQVLKAVQVGMKAGLRLPLVYNSGGYDSVEFLRLLDGIVDIYLPDMKFDDPSTANRYLRVADYPETNRAAVREMHRQVGDLVIDADGLAKRGLLVRHLILPRDLADTEMLMHFLADEISRNTYVNIMDRYQPVYNTRSYPEIDRLLNGHEVQAAIDAAHRAGLLRLENGRAPLPK